MITTDIITLTIPDDLSPEGVQLLKKHGCTIRSMHCDLAVITFPPGTTKHRIYPVIHLDKYKILLPDGVCFLSTYVDFRGFSTIAHVPSELVDKLNTNPM